MVFSVSPFLGIYIYGINSKHAYSKSYYAALVDKTNRLEEIKDKKKIVIIGGSGVAFGLESELLKKYYPDYEVQNFGLYADLGIKLMLDLSKDYIGKDDIVIIAPEMSNQTMSLYFNPLSFLKATEERTNLFRKLDEDNKKDVFSNYLYFLQEKNTMSDDVELVGVYQRKNLNEYGDISYYEDVDGEMVSMRTSNIMSLRYDVNTPISIAPDVIDNDFIKYINDYSYSLSLKGATTLFDYSPINKLAVTSSTEDKIAFQKKINAEIQFPIIGNVDDHIISNEYFYDSNFHMNDTGAIYNTLLLIRDLKTYYDDGSYVEDYPEKPKRGSDIYNETDEDIVNSKYFTFEEHDGGYYLTGLSEEGCNKEELTIPGFYQGVRVVRLMKFDSENIVRNLVIPECQTLIDDGFLSSFTKLQTVHILEKNPNNLSIGFELLLGKDDISIYVPKKSFESYATDYFWSSCYAVLKGE